MRPKRSLSVDNIIVGRRNNDKDDRNGNEGLHHGNNLERGQKFGSKKLGYLFRGRLTSLVDYDKNKASTQFSNEPEPMRKNIRRNASIDILWNGHDACETCTYR